MVIGDSWLLEDGGRELKASLSRTEVWTANTSHRTYTFFCFHATANPSTRALSITITTSRQFSWFNAVRTTLYGTPTNPDSTNTQGRPRGQRQRPQSAGGNQQVSTPAISNGRTPNRSISRTVAA